MLSLLLLSVVQDRYADAQAPPPIDASQDWTLVAGEEEDGYTVLQFTRPWITCDDRDRNIEVSLHYSLFSADQKLLQCSETKVC